MKPERRNWLAEASQDTKSKPTAAVLYGVPGIGKTSFAAHMPGCVFLTDKQEDGISTLKRSGLVPQSVPVFPPVASWPEVLEVLDDLENGKHQFRGLVIDALTGIERLCHEHVCAREFGGDWGERGFAGYGRGVLVSLAEWRAMLCAVDRVREKRGMSVLCLAHAKAGTHKNPEGADWIKWVPDVADKTWAMTSKWADMVLFANFHVEVTGKSDTRGKGRGGKFRIVHTEYDAAFEAKNRHGLPAEFSLGSGGQEGWANFTNLMTEAMNRKGN